MTLKKGTKENVFSVRLHVQVKQSSSYHAQQLKTPVLAMLSFLVYDRTLHVVNIYRPPAILGKRTNFASCAEMLRRSVLSAKSTMSFMP